MDSFDITASALTAQRLRMDTISSNLANVNTTRQADGTVGAYRRKNVVFAPILAQANDQINPFGGGSSPASGIQMKSSPSGISIGPDGRPMITAGVSSQKQAFGGAGVQVVQIGQDEKTPMRLVYDPTHPDANEKGYVEMPNVNVVTEMVDMISATRAYEANVSAMQSAKGMAQSALEL